MESPAFWPDFHARFVNYWCEALAEVLPDDYEARMDERVSLVELSGERIRRMEPDLAVTRGGPSRGGAAATTGVATLEPVMIPLVIEEETRETYIEILHRPDRELVAVLELLSPANKENPGRRAYLVKRNAVLQQEVHLVEVDLLLGGRRLPLRDELPAGDYFALVARADHRPDCAVYAWTVQQSLPRIPIPLKAPDPDVWIDLGSIFAVTYEKGRYARSVDYGAAPAIPLPAEQFAWIREQAQRQRAAP
jgi:hypothetical protein